jgi:membrane associated rhomboid family serine protease
MIGLVRLSPVIRPLRRAQNIKFIINYQRRSYSHSYGAKDPIFPLGLYSSLIKPALFTVGVIGGSLFIAEYAVRHKYAWKDITDSIKRSLNTSEWVPPGRGTMMVLVAANVAAFIALQAPNAAVILHRYFTHSIMNRRVSTMILSCFGHGGFLHILANMYMLYTFFPPIQKALGPERTLALYFSAGAFSSFMSHINMLLRRSPIPSLGASGAICGLFATFCMLYPDAKLQLLILPGVGLEAKYMLFVPVCIETVLFLASPWWRIGIDFAAHLGGFAFGAAYVWGLKQYAKHKRLHR